MKSKEMRLTFIENLRSIAAGCVLALSPIVLIATFLAPSASAQTTSGDIAGTIKDSLGAAIPNVSITVTNEKTGTQSTTKTNAAGQFQVQNLLPGLYDIQASASGFSNCTLKALTVVPNSASTANLSLSVGTVSTSIEVTGGAGVVLDTTTQNLTQTFDAEQLQALPTAAVGGANQNGVLNVSLLGGDQREVADRIVRHIDQGTGHGLVIVVDAFDLEVVVARTLAADRRTDTDTNTSRRGHALNGDTGAAIDRPLINPTGV